MCVISIWWLYELSIYGVHVLMCKYGVCVGFEWCVFCGHGACIFFVCCIYGNKWSPVDVYGIYVVCGVCVVHV